MKTSGGLRRSTCSALLLALLAVSPVGGAMDGVAFANQMDGAGRPVAANGTGTPFELTFWESVANSNDRAQYEAYLAQYPTGTFSGLARAKIASLAPPVVVSAPAPVPAPVASTGSAAAPVATAPAPLAIPVAPAVAVAAPVPTAVPAAPVSLLDLMAALGKGSPVNPTALFTSTGPVPSRPVLEPVATPAVPDHFCSAVARNSFHDSVYVPAVAQADRNNAATIAHLQNVQSLHAQAMAAGNIAGANALAQEATTFKPIADQAYSGRIAMNDLFARIMAAPITGC
ncbi:MAG: hypothetical protein ABW048_05225 [Sphingobium sp.]